MGAIDFERHQTIDAEKTSGKETPLAVLARSLELDRSPDKA
jgi:hypothetical protein